MRILVTGIAGFAGRHLLPALVEAGHEVHGVVLDPATVPGAASVQVVDLLDADAMARAVGEVVPEAVVHLAAISFVPHATANPRLAVRVNVEGTTGLLHAVEMAVPKARVLVVGSADAYGRVAPHELPVDEDVPLRPLSVYGATKAAAEVFALQWGRHPGRDVVVARPFNHTGPGQEATFVVPAFARQIARIAAGTQEPVVRVGDLSPVRDLSDVRDVVRGYVALLERGESGAVYNLCAGQGTAIGAILDGLIAAAGVEVRIEQDPALMRPVDVPRLVGSHERVTRATGWRPEIRLVKTLTDVLANCRAPAGE